MRNRKMIREFAKSHDHKVKGFLYLLTTHSDMKHGHWLWYRDFEGTMYLVHPKLKQVSHMFNIHTGMNIEG